MSVRHPEHPLMGEPRIEGRRLFAMALFAGLILLLGCVAWVSSDRAQPHPTLKAAFAAIRD